MIQGTNADQDKRFSDKEKKLMKSMKFEDSLLKKVSIVLIFFQKRKFSPACNFWYSWSRINGTTKINEILYTAMWIRIVHMRIRIHKIWWMRIQIQIQDSKITKLISTHLLIIRKKIYF